MSAVVRRACLVLAVGLGVVGLTACPEEQPPDCDTVDLTCQPLYPPTFANVYTNTLQDGCGSDESSCHSPEGKKGGMSFATADEAYTALLQNGRVIPGNPSCSEAIVRVIGVGHDYQMPPGDELPAAERCALIQWVQAGAPGPVAVGAP